MCVIAAVNDFDVSGILMTGNITEATTEQCFNISITDDNRREDTETFTVQFDVTDSQGSFLYNPVSAIVSIEDDDGKCICMITVYYHSQYSFLAVLILGFEMASYTFQESSGQLSNAITIVKENNVVVDVNVAVTVNLNPARQTAETCRCA